jgi:hypothetical protein
MVSLAEDHPAGVTPFWPCPGGIFGQPNEAHFLLTGR